MVTKTFSNLFKQGKGVLFVQFAFVLFIALALVRLSVLPAFADSATIDFESYTVGSVNGQDGWSSTGAAGSGCAVYDHAIVDSTPYGYGSFGTRSLRISNAVTSGCFGDQTFSKPLVDEAGETAAYVDVPSGTRQEYFVAQWDFASTVPGAEQAGLSVVASPDRGDGGRMSWVQMRDTPSGLEVNFYDYQDAAPYGSVATPTDGYGPEDDFIFTNLASGLDRTVPHTIRIEVFLVDGPRNDVVRIYVDGVLEHTGTTWEDYFRWVQGPGGPEQTAPVHESRVIRSMLFRTGGTAAPATAGNGFLIDNLSITSSAVPQCTTTCYVDAVNGNDAFGGTSPADAKKTIQAGVDQVDPGGTVIVVAGTYVEQVEITKPLTLDGSGPGVTIIESPAALSEFFTTSANNYPIVYVHGTDDVTVQHLTVDGAGKGNSNYRFVGIGYSDAGGAIDDVVITGIRDTPISGTQHGVGILAFAESGTPRSLTISDSTLSDYQKNGMVLAGADLTANVTGNTVTGAGAVNFIAQNGIQVSGGANAEIEDNTVSGHSYTPFSWVSTGMLLYGAGSADTSGNTVSENQVGIYVIDTPGDHDGNTVSASSAGTASPYFWGIVVDSPPPAHVPSPFEDQAEAKSEGFRSSLQTLTFSVQQVTVTNNVLTGDGTASGIGLEADSGFGSFDIDLAVTNNFIQDWGVGVEIYECSGGCTGTTFSNLHVNLNSITGNLLGFDHYSPTFTADGEKNWWGSASGPTHASNPGGTGDSSSDDVDFDPWLCDGTDTSPAIGFQPDVSIFCTTPVSSALVINEVDYDQDSTDTAEFIEIKNVSGGAVDLDNYQLKLVNGAGGGAAVYQTIDLPAVSLAAGDYFVVCGDAANVPNCDLDVTPNTNLIQNGAPDAIGLFDVTTSTLVDAVSYEGNSGAPFIEGSGTGLEDDASEDEAGLSRYPDGADTNQNNADFSLRCISPGEANLAESSDCVDFADLQVTKSDNVDPIFAGQPLTYTVLVTNNGPDAAENVVVTDTLPAGVSFNFSTITQGTCSITFPTLECQVGDMTAGDTVTLTIQVTPNEAGVITNSVTAASDTIDPDESNNSDSEGTTVLNTGTITIVKQASVSGSFDFTGDLGGFSLNSGGSATFDDVDAGVYAVTETDPAPAFVLTGLSCDDANSTVDVGARTASIHLEPGEHVTCTFTNETAHPKIAVDKIGPVIAEGDTPITYTYTLTNPGNAPLGNVSVSDDKCSPVLYQSGDDGDGLLEPGEAWVFTCTYTPSFPDYTAHTHDSRPRKLRNTATATGSYGDTTVEAQDSFTLYPLTLIKEIYLYWNWHNRWSSVPYGLPDNTYFTLEARKNNVVVGTFTFSQDDPLSLWLSEGTFIFKEINMPYGYRPVYSNPLTYVAGKSSHTTRLFPNLIQFNLAVEKTGPETARKGDTITYTYAVTNSGPALVAPKVTDNKCSPLTYTGGDTDLDGLVDPGETWIFECRYKVTTKAGKYITNIARVTDANAPRCVIGGDMDLSNNKDWWKLLVVP